MPNYARVMVLADEWLPEAREDFATELEYIYSEFGAKAAENVFWTASTTSSASHTSASIFQHGLSRARSKSIEHETNFPSLLFLGREASDYSIVEQPLR